MNFNIKTTNQYNQNMSSIESNSVLSFEFRNKISMEDVDNRFFNENQLIILKV
jgi:hypothetical protein